jgi:hypothetical protein
MHPIVNPFYKKIPASFEASAKQEDIKYLGEEKSGRGRCMIEKIVIAFPSGRLPRMTGSRKGATAAATGTASFFPAAEHTAQCECDQCKHNQPDKNCRKICR